MVTAPEAQPSSLGQLHADIGTGLDASITAGQEWGLRYFQRTPLVSLERLHVAFDADPKFTAELNQEANLRYLHGRLYQQLRAGNAFHVSTLRNL